MRYMELIRRPEATATATTARINSAIAATRVTVAANRKYGGTVLLAPGDYYIDDSVLFGDIWGATLKGSGHSTRLIWNGAAGSAIVKMENARNCRLEDIMITVANPAHAGLHIFNGGVSTVRSVQNMIVNVWIDGGGNVEQGFKLGGEGTTDANNDFIQFDNCWVTDYIYAGATLEEASQSYNNQFRNCQFTSFVGGQYGVKTGTNVAGSFIWSGGAMAGNTVADFHVGRSTQPTLIEFCNSENGRRLLQTPATNYSLITVRGCRFAGNSIAENDDVLDLYYNSGVVNIEGNHFYSVATPLTFWRRGVSGALNFRGNMIMSPNYPNPASLWALENDLTVNLDGNVLMDVNLNSVEF